MFRRELQIPEKSTVAIVTVRRMKECFLSSSTSNKILNHCEFSFIQIFSAALSIREKAKTSKDMS
jgi:hypothetical protein